MHEELGRGSFSVCRRCTHKSGDEYAVKVGGGDDCNPNARRAQIIDKRKRDPSEEIDILLRHSHHANIAHLYAVYEDDNALYLVQELCRGGELLDHILRAKHFSEAKAAALTAKLAAVVAYLHAHQVCRQPATREYRKLQPACLDEPS